MTATVIGVPFSQLLEPAPSESASARPWVPHKVDGKTLQDRFVTYKALVSLSCQCVREISSHRDMPDPSYVGENACQIRSTLYASYFQSDEIFTVLEESAKALQGVQKKINAKPAIDTKCGGSLRDFLDNNACDFLLDRRVYNLILGYVLHVYETSIDRFEKVEGIMQPTDDKVTMPIFESFGFTKGQREALVKRFKKKLAYASVEFTQEIAQTLPEKQSHDLLPMISGSQVRITENELAVIPCFSVGKILFSYACAQEIPLIVKIHRIDNATEKEAGYSLFFFRAIKNAYEPCSFKDLRDKQVAILTEATSVSTPCLETQELEEELHSRPIVETLMAFMAVHPSYGGGLKKEAGPVEEREEREAYKQKAEAWGCSVNNPKICRPYHMSAAFIEKFKPLREICHN